MTSSQVVSRQVMKAPGFLLDFGCSVWQASVTSRSVSLVELL
jgi:hypothetical protein